MTEKATHITFLVLALGLLALMASQVRKGTESALGSTLRNATGPVAEGVLKAAGGAQGVWDNYVNLRSVRDENQKLREQLDQLGTEHARYAEIYQENMRLREMLELRSPQAFPKGRVARVISLLNTGPLQRGLMVDRGLSDGVTRGWVAVYRGMLVGRVTEVAGGSAGVMTLLDPESGVGVRHQLDRYTGVLRGGNKGPAQMTRLMFVPRDTQVAVGDPLVTSGLDGAFPPGLLVGFVRDLAEDDLLTWTIGVEPAVDPVSVEELLLVPPPLGSTP
ncbi:MAG: rod shape-determining protein MreC [Acidobacteriota bacterium]